MRYTNARQVLLLLVAFAISMPIMSMPITSSANLKEQELEKHFQGFKAAFEIYDMNTGQCTRFHPELCSVQLSPCSTFKIFNSLAGLETGVLRNENHSMTWDGIQSLVCNCNKDQTLQSAVSNSCVWYFQRVAKAIGEERMQKFLSEVDYGNKDISGGIDRFWLGSSLKISADEQVSFFKKLVNDELPFSKRSMAIVRGIIRLEQTDKGTLYGKTGSDMQDGKKVLGWFVGYLVQPKNIYVFATNIQATDDASGIKAKEITKEILKEMALL